jgi:hypothetical protein
MGQVEEQRERRNARDRAKYIPRPRKPGKLAGLTPKERRAWRTETQRIRRGTPPENYRATGDQKPHTECMTREELRAYARQRHRLHAGIRDPDRFRVQDGFNPTRAAREEEKRKAEAAAAGAKLMSAIEAGDEDEEDRAWERCLEIARRDPLLEALKKVHGNEQR